MDRISPPWDSATVDALNAYQADAPMHPFTCPHRGLGHQLRSGDRDRGVLVATAAGWTCRDCPYTQDWAWPWMADNSWWQGGEDVQLVPPEALAAKDDEAPA